MKLQIKQHADRSEEEQPEDVAQGDDVAQGLVAVFRFAQNQAGHEGAEGKREAEQVSGVADTQADGGDGKDEEFAGVASGPPGPAGGAVVLCRRKASGREKAPT